MKCFTKKRPYDKKFLIRILSWKNVNDFCLEESQDIQNIPG